MQSSKMDIDTVDNVDPFVIIDKPSVSKEEKKKMTTEKKISKENTQKKQLKLKKMKRKQKKTVWLQEIISRNQNYMTDELKSKFSRNAMKQKYVGRKQKKCRNYIRANNNVYRSWAQGNARVNQYNKVSNISLRQEQQRSAAVKSVAQMNQISDYMNLQLFSNSSSSRNDEEDELLDDRFEAMMDVLDTEIAVDEQDNVALRLDAKTVNDTLSQLKTEPKDDEELKQKFKLYEDFLKTVELSRKAIFDFWKTSKIDFKDAPYAIKQVESDIKNIDCDDNLGIIFDERIWFVYNMFKQANINNNKLKNLLKSINTKYDLIQNFDDDCPFCLEPLQDCKDDIDNGVITLKCCHKACNECWKNWQELQGKRAFCPLCKHEAFLENLYQRQK